MRGVVNFSIPEERDPQLSREKLRAFLVSHVAYVSMRGAREKLIYALATLGLLAWLMVIWPRSMPGVLQEFVKIFCGVLLFATLVTGFLEWSWYRKEQNCLSQMRGSLSHRLEK